MRSILPLPVVLFAVVLLTACGDREPAASAPPAPSPDVWKGEGTHVEVVVDDIHCAGCERTVTNALMEVEGVLDVEADADTDLVTIELEEGAARDAVIPALRDAIHRTHKRVVGEDVVRE